MLRLSSKRYRFILVVTLLIWVFILKLKKEHEVDPNNLLFSEQDTSSSTQFPFYKTCLDTNAYKSQPEYRKMNAAFIMLTRNSELSDVVNTMNSIESHFNQWFNYPYVFLNDVPFTDEFKDKIHSLTSSKVEFGTLSEVEWEFPQDVRESFEFFESIEDQGDRGIMYGSMVTYHQMCRFYSGIFYKHPLVSQYEWYWRIEPDVDFYCDLTYDPFYEMWKHDKKYGFTVLLDELYWSVPNLFRYTINYIKSNKIKLGTLWKLFTYNYHILDTQDENLDKFVNYEQEIQHKISEKIAIDSLTGKINEEGLQYLINRATSKVPIMEDKFENEEYNLCHFWSNFEIARLDVFNNNVYNAYFKFLEESGGFWKERWGDAPVHSLGLALTLDLNEIHYFRDIGYRHSTINHCPKNSKSMDENSYFEAEPRFKRKRPTYDTPVNYGIGCRCKCPKRTGDVEDAAFQCMSTWYELAHDMNFQKFSNGKYVPMFDAKDVERQMKEDFQKQFL
ncbi:hypothetical protein KAFR_0J01280 [Kazachstania africana CBS 2517]|uniref:Mannosyltransferase n=1 Tax=Kazachstania africana (strain ATCC 22294 / BCRC 22015 / CBS 2517 / CECT 1963 / NBRC 1671 / NRRL Y-8276) TaxID=1071382 RepID=H2B0P5_KAZAF|nr:hypothetical protein KAFR_0J01280 [Kazachstania africana CBS 2517]CCF60195.1 hypothetical protein KAFR_0J01280 [Kazachstania africana CBS 2517]